MTVTFGDGHGVVWKKDGTIVLTSQCENRMYIIDDLDDNPPMAMTSLSQLVSLEQWHRHFTHCSPLTIAKMTKAKLVDGLMILGNEL